MQASASIVHQPARVPAAAAGCDTPALIVAATAPGCKEHARWLSYLPLPYTAEQAVDTTYEAGVFLRHIVNNFACLPEVRLVLSSCLWTAAAHPCVLIAQATAFIAVSDKADNWADASVALCELRRSAQGSPKSGLSLLFHL